MTNMFSLLYFSGGYSLGEHTLFVPNALYAENRRRLCERLKKISLLPPKSYVLLQGGDTVSLYDTDVCYNDFRQVSYPFQFGDLTRRDALISYTINSSWMLSSYCFPTIFTLSLHFKEHYS